MQDEIWDSRARSSWYPANAKKLYPNLQEANYAAENICWKILREVIKQDSKWYTADLAQRFPVGEDNPIAVQYNRAEDMDGIWRVREIYVCGGHSVKVRAWVHWEPYGLLS